MSCSSSMTGPSHGCCVRDRSIRKRRGMGNLKHFIPESALRAGCRDAGCSTSALRRFSAFEEERGDLAERGGNIFRFALRVASSPVWIVFEAGLRPAPRHARPSRAASAAPYGRSRRGTRRARPRARYGHGVPVASTHVRRAGSVQTRSLPRSRSKSCCMYCG